MPVITSANNPTISGAFEAQRGSLFQNHGRFYNARMQARNIGNRVNAFVNNQTLAARDYMRTGPTAKAGLNTAWNKLFSGPGHRMGRRWAREAIGLHELTRTERSAAARMGKQVGSRFFGRFLGAGFTAVSAYEGYKKEGVWGAVKGGATAIGEQYLFGRLIGGIGPIGMAVGAGLGAAYLTYKIPKMINEASARYRKGYEGVDLAHSTSDPFGMNATMRQRSLLAIQNSRLNARSGIGQEALATYRPYHR